MSDRATRPYSLPAWAADAVGIGVFVALLVTANRIGQNLLDHGYRTRILAPPLLGRFETNVSWRGLPMVLIAAVAVAWLPRFAAHARWKLLIWSTGAGLVAWSIALAFNRSGWSEIGRPMALPGHYLGEVPAIGSPADFLRRFVENIDQYGTHVRAHPPGFVLLLWLLDRIGLGGAQWAGALVIAGGALAVPAILIATRELAGEQWARRSAPWLVVAPGALFVASTADAFFAGAMAWGFALIVLASTAADSRRAGLALGGGVLLGGGLMLSYGMALFALPTLAVVVVRRAWTAAMYAAIGVVGVLGGFAWSGFWWFDGLSATRREYRESVAQERPYWSFLLMNLAAFAVIVGPAAITAIRRAREPHLRRFAMVVGVGAVMMLGAAVSGLSKGETERIWLPFALWVVPAGAMLVVGRSGAATRRWLAAQCATAMAVQCFVRTNW